jgi:hypothetical protein
MSWKFRRSSVTPLYVSWWRKCNDAVFCTQFAWYQITRYSCMMSAHLLYVTAKFFSLTYWPRPVLIVAGFGKSGWIPKLGSRHRRISQTLEKICWEWGSGERKISSGMEKQKCTAETVYHEGIASRSYDVCHKVGWVNLRYIYTKWSIASSVFEKFSMRPCLLAVACVSYFRKN